MAVLSLATSFQRLQSRRYALIIWAASLKSSPEGKELEIVSNAPKNHRPARLGMVQFYEFIR